MQSQSGKCLGDVSLLVVLRVLSILARKDNGETGQFRVSPLGVASFGGLELEASPPEIRF